MPDSSDTLVKRLREWTKNHDPHVRAAVELLIRHELWLRRPDFIKACVHADGDGSSWIRWGDARQFADGNPQGSTTQVAILNLAVAVGENRYRFSMMGDASAEAIVIAVASALNVEIILGDSRPGAHGG